MSTEIALQRIQECIDTNSETLDLSELELNEIPESVTKFHHLKVLNLHNNKISDLKPLSQLNNLTTLRLTYNQISNLQPLSQLTNLTDLNLDNNQISDLKPLSQLNNLSRLDLYNNQISDLKPLSQLNNLSRLDLYNNQISDLKPLSQLTNLTDLDLGNNQISDLKPLSQLNNLTTLRLIYNQISNLQPLSQLTNLTDLNLYNNQISDLKPLSQLNNLSRLDLDNNQISDLKPLSQLTNLTDLDLGNNQISDLKPLSQLNNLTTLRLTYNQISDLKPLSQLTNLTDLNLYNNQISDLKPLSQLTNLTDLNLYNNQISDLKPLSQLNNLSRLDLDNNQISDLKPLSQLTNLTDLNLDNNQISDLKPLSQLNNLTWLILTKNPIHNQNEYFQNSGNQFNEFKLYRKVYLEKFDSIAIKLPEKVVFLGNHGAGKSSALYYLKHAQAKVITNKKNEESTHVLNIDYISPLVDKPKNSETSTEVLPYASCYDFGGQDFYHGIYRIFIKQAGHVVLLVNPSDNINKLDYQQDSANQQLSKHKTHYFDLRYWRGLLNYMAHGQKDSPSSLQLVQSHANTEHAMPQWHYPNLYQAHGLSGFYHLSLAKNPEKKNGIRTENEKKEGKVTSTTNNTDTQKANTIDVYETNRQSFKAEFEQLIWQKQLEDNYPKVFITFLQGLYSQTLTLSNTKNKLAPHDHTTLGQVFDYLSELEVQLDQENVLSIENVQTLMTLYTEKGIVLYDKNLTNNKDNTDLHAHILWLYPKALVEYIHRNFLSHDKMATFKGRVPTSIFKDILIQKNKTKEHKSFNKNDIVKTDAIISLLENNQVIFEHHYPEKTDNTDIANGDTEYIIPNYLSFAEEDTSYNLASFGLETPDFSLKFADFIPLGMINQLVCHFGSEPDKKLFWRDCLVFTLKDAGCKCLIHIDMEQLNIKVSIAKKPNSSGSYHSFNEALVLRYLFYCIMSSYWSFHNNILPVSYEIFRKIMSNNLLENTLTKKFKDNIGKQLKLSDRDNKNDTLDKILDNVSFQQLLFIKELFNLDESYIPQDMYLSRDNRQFIKYQDLTDETLELTINSYKLAEIEISDCKKYNDCEPFVRDNTLPIALFQLFTTRKLKKMVNIFLSYSRKDIKYKEALFDHLGLLSRDSYKVFDCTQNNAGKWDTKIQTALEEADIVIFLMSINFFNSEYIFHKELKNTLEGNMAGKKQIIMPVLVKMFDYDSLSQLNIPFNDEIKDSNNNDKKSVTKELSTYQYFPYYRDERNYDEPKEYLKPIALWNQAEQDLAYTQIVQQIRKEVEILATEK